ncbi:MAG: CapA family protein [Lachnospiraceae bacterium]
MNKRIQRAGCLVVGILLLIGGVCLIKNRIQETSSNSIQKVNEDSKTGQIEELSETENVYEEILNGCTQKFIGNKPIDENFLNWFHSHYGDDSINRIVDAVRNQQMESELWYELTGNSIQVLWISYCQDTGFQSELIENTYYKECASEDEIVLDFTGDINLAEGWSTTKFMDRQANGIFDCLSSDLILELQNADILMMNNEYTYSDRGYPIPGKAYTFRAAPSRVEVLQQLGVDIVSLANNHVYDYGEEALLDTFDTLERAEIPYVGAGRNFDEAKKIVYFVANGRKIAIVSATQIERSYNYTKEATEDMPGVLKTLNPDKFLEVIKEAEKNSDYVIAYPHWGTEGTNVYGSDQKELAEAYVEAGADVIIGGHTHCLQGISYIEDIPVIYSLGNFWFNGNTIETGVAQVRIQKDGSIRFRFLPCIQSGTRTRLLTEGSQREEVLDFMRSLSKEVEIDKDGYVTNLAK